MDGRLIDLQRYKNKGVTLIITFSNVTSPFMVVVTDEVTKKVLYYREFDASRLIINIPKHSDLINIVVGNEVKIKDVLITEIRKHNIRYTFNEDIITPRNYRVDQIQTRYFPVITRKERNNIKLLSTPAQFIPYTGEIHIGQLTFDPLPQPVQEFVLKHEKGHYFYARPYIPDEYIIQLPIPHKEKDNLIEGFKEQKEQDELEADRYALYQFINDGYNFSGALKSLMDTLPKDHFSTERIVKLHNEIKKIHKLNEL